MSIVILLLIIPVFSIGLVMYITNLCYFFSTGEFDEIIFIISMVLTVPTSYLIPYIFTNIIKSKNINYLNNKNKITIISNYFSMILLLLLGIALLYRGIINLNYTQIIFGVGIVLLFGYGTYTYFIHFDEKEFILKSINRVNDSNELTFVNNDITITYYTNDNEYVGNQKYVLKYNKYINSVKRINGMVVGGETDEKDNKEKHKKETSRV